MLIMCRHYSLRIVLLKGYRPKHKQLPHLDNIINGIVCNNKFTQYSIMKRKPEQHDDKPFQEVACKAESPIKIIEAL